MSLLGLPKFLIKFLQTKNNNFKSFRFFFAKSMLTIIRKVILDNLMQKEIEFIILKNAKKLKCLQTGSGISVHVH